MEARRRGRERAVPAEPDLPGAPVIGCASEEKAVPHAPTPLHAEWDRFIDALDSAGQNGSVENIEIPATLALAGVDAGTRFGELSPEQVSRLVRFALKLNRRGDVVQVLWRDMRDRARRKALEARRQAKTESTKTRHR